VVYTATVSATGLLIVVNSYLLVSSSAKTDPGTCHLP